MTVLGDVTPEMTAFRQELFGPVAAITVAKNAEHALALANDSDFGLSATVFTADEALAQKMASRLECGGIYQWLQRQRCPRCIWRREEKWFWPRAFTLWSA